MGACNFIFEGERYIIDQGNESQHPPREGEECDFWTPDDD